MWFPLILKRGDVEILVLKITVDPACTEPGVYHINRASHMIEIFQILIVALTKEA